MLWELRHFQRIALFCSWFASPFCLIKLSMSISPTWGQIINCWTLISNIWVGIGVHHLHTGFHSHGHCVADLGGYLSWGGKDLLTACKSYSIQNQSIKATSNTIFCLSVIGQKLQSTSTSVRARACVFFLDIPCLPARSKTPHISHESCQILKGLRAETLSIVKFSGILYSSWYSLHAVYILLSVHMPTTKPTCACKSKPKILLA